MRTRKQLNPNKYAVTCFRCNTTIEVRRQGILKAWLWLHGKLCRGVTFPPSVRT